MCPARPYRKESPQEHTARKKDNKSQENTLGKDNKHNDKRKEREQTARKDRSKKLKKRLLRKTPTQTPQGNTARYDHNVELQDRPRGQITRKTAGKDRNTKTAEIQQKTTIRTNRQKKPQGQTTRKDSQETQRPQGRTARPQQTSTDRRKRARAKTSENDHQRNCAINRWKLIRAKRASAR